MGISELLGIDVEPRDLSVLQMLLRSVVIFFCALLMVRMANKRFLAKLAPFDVILGFMLGAMLSRAVNGSAAFGPTIIAGFALVLLHRLVSRIAYHSPAFGQLIKGNAVELVRDGQMKRDQLKTRSVSDNDLLEAARLNGRVERVEDIKVATLERNGHISVIKKRGA